ncbi:hypothetical protein HELRODRAFT_175839 [Helobdella robusta]|uniref:Bromodomain adjacent to zinc finger domain protein 1A n=1 Tax=Helobdella robusta TaxID=6412 RepID=T1F9R1_HELRO|nr:hypothetical protein HELRODRAFT_175839 [Helobdella robusta]ESO00418.1 hypothetical protein HELRODRAFT_175839 [Helobdella robusta]
MIGSRVLWLSDSKPAEQNSANTKKKISILDLKDKDFEEMPVEGIDWDQLSQEEKDHIRNWSTRRQNELQQIVDNLQSECFLTPIGTDRTYRRYWWFRSVPGLFVEDSKVHSWTVPRCCLLPIKQNETRIEMSLRAALSGNKIGSSNEQKSTNTIDKYFIADIKKEITETVNSNKSTSNETTATNSKTLSYMNVNEQLRIRNTVEWSAFNSAQQVDALIERLNRRGYRENLLRTYLINNRDKIVISFSTNANDSSNFSTNKSDISNNIVEHIFDWLLCEQRSITSKNASCDESKPLVNESADHNNVDAKHKVNNTKSKKSCVEHFGGIAGELELMRCVADMLLDLEERIFAGSLGQLKDLDRDLWRKELECTDEQMKGGQAGLKDEQPCMYSGSNSTVDDDIDVDDAQMRFNKKNLKKMMKMMVDIQQMIEEKYLLPPLAEFLKIGENEETKLKRTKVLEQQQQIEQQDQYHLVQANYGDEMDTNTNHVFKGMDIKSKNGYTIGSLTSLNNSTNKLLNKSCVSGGDVSHNGFNINSISNNCDTFNNINCLTNDYSGNVNICNDSNVNSSNHFNNSSNLFKWLSCVEGSNNFSHLYLCTVLLDMSIAWSKSALNARCKICRKKKDADLMLLCDGCDQGHHMYCLKPPLKKIPEGDWYCPMCRPKEFSIVVCPRKVTENIKYEDLESDCDDEANESSAATNNVAETGNDGIWALADQDDKTSSEYVGLILSTILFVYNVDIY